MVSCSANGLSKRVGFERGAFCWIESSPGQCDAAEMQADPQVYSHKESSAANVLCAVALNETGRRKLPINSAVFFLCLCTGCKGENELTLVKNSVRCHKICSANSCFSVNGGILEVSKLDSHEYSYAVFVQLSVEVSGHWGVQRKQLMS